MLLYLDFPICLFYGFKPFTAQQTPVYRTANEYVSFAIPYASHTSRNRALESKRP